MLDNNMQQQPMNTSSIDTINAITKAFKENGISYTQATFCFTDLINSLDNFFTNGGDSYEIRGGKGNKKMAMIQPRTDANAESSNRKYDLEIFDENGDSRLKMPFDEDYVYIIPTAQEKPMKVVFENDEFIWKGEVNPIDTN